MTTDNPHELMIELSNLADAMLDGQGLLGDDTPYKPTATIARIREICDICELESSEAKDEVVREEAYRQRAIRALRMSEEDALVSLPGGIVSQLHSMTFNLALVAGELKRIADQTDPSLDQSIEAAYDAFRDEYARQFPQGGDEGDHAEATRCGVEAVMVYMTSGAR